MTPRTLITGFPRMGEHRELKKGLESFWKGSSTEDELQEIAKDLRARHWLLQKEAGIDLISVNDFSLYDQMLDTILMFGAEPQRFKAIENRTERYFAMARATEDQIAMEMTKWFNTNYHYIVPELDGSTEFSLDASKIVSEYREAKALGVEGKINIIGPVSFLALSKTKNGEDPLSYYDNVIEVYEQLFNRIADLADTVYVQVDEPVFVRDPSEKQLALLKDSCVRLGSVSSKIRLIVTTYFDHSCEATDILMDTPVWGIGLDFVYGDRNMAALSDLGDKYLVAGVVDGRNVWANDLSVSLAMLETIERLTGTDRIIVSTSCSLQHVPYTAVNEPDSTIKKWLAFAVEKVAETVLLGRLFHEGDTGARDALAENRKLLAEKARNPLVCNNAVAERLAAIEKNTRDGSFDERISLQHDKLALPLLPTTTIGSFPQTPELRKMRRAFRNGDLGEAAYEEGIRAYIDDCIRFQEQAGLDVLVHGEPERNDMVEYFGEMLDGFHFTGNGWVQSYGSRCVKPPVIYGDISRPAPMTVRWISHAQGSTKKTVKGMLTGPVTILNWSFVRNDLPRNEVSRQIAVALSDEIADLQEAGIRIVQVDEAAFKEGYPLRSGDVPAYEKWAVDHFRLAVSTARKETQIHTHMCYSEFNDCIKTIEAMDADVITIETARSGNELLHLFRETGYANEIGPGVYDIHSPRVPPVDEFEKEIRLRLAVVDWRKMWVNPDCGLKTRTWSEVKPALENMVAAAEKVRRQYGSDT